jgi:DNA-binding LacI/PurR family transcriptional regulator
MTGRTGTSRRGPARPTLDEVATLAGVSIATVSRVLNGTARVSPATRDAVEAAVARLAYVPNRAARSLVTRRTDTIALVLSEPETRVFSDPFFAAVVHGVLTAIADTELQLVLLIAQGEREHAKVERYVRQGHVDGVMLMSLHGDDPLPRRLVEAGVPTVLTGRPASAQRVPYVDADNRGGARAATEYLVSSDRRVVATITGPLDMTVAIDRFAGYRDVVARPDEVVANGDFTVGGGERAMRDLLARRPDLDAVFVASDPMAAGALHALQAEGRRVPEEVAVVGFDDAPLALATRPPLTTVRQPLEEMTRALTDLLLRRIAGTVPDHEHVVCETTLVRRASA